MVLRNLLPAIKKKWPGRKPQQIFIQEEKNAPVHSAATTKSVAQEAFLKHSLHVQVVKQPPRSPEFNALDCGIFNNSLQKKVYRACPRSIGEFKNLAKTAFDNLHRDKIDDVFLSVHASELVQSCVIHLMTKKSNLDGQMSQKHVCIIVWKKRETKKSKKQGCTSHDPNQPQPDGAGSYDPYNTPLCSKKVALQFGKWYGS